MKSARDSDHQELVQRLLDGELDALAASAVLKEHPELTGELRAHQGLRRALSTLRDAEPAVGFEDRVMRRVGEHQAAQESSWWTRAKALWLPSSLALAAVASAVLLVMGLPQESGTHQKGVAGSSVMTAGRLATVTLRVRAGLDHWVLVRGALEKAGLEVPQQPRTDGPVVVVEQRNVPVSSVLAAIQELSARMPVEVSGMTAAQQLVNLRLELGGL